VIPAFIHGLGNNIAQDIQWNFGKEAHRTHAVVTVFGPPVDYADLMLEKPRPTLYKKCADRFMGAVKALMTREREIRAELLAGTIAESDERWLNNRPVGKIYAREA
ncbi:MAG: hypothetical protein ABI867_38325, partial [Kofleriaceae bacterium]